MPDWVINAMISIDERAIGFEKEAEESTEFEGPLTKEDGPTEGDEA